MRPATLTPAHDRQISREREREEFLKHSPNDQARIIERVKKILRYEKQRNRPVKSALWQDALEVYGINVEEL